MLYFAAVGTPVEKVHTLADDALYPAFLFSLVLIIKYIIYIVIINDNNSLYFMTILSFNNL